MTVRVQSCLVGLGVSCLIAMNLAVGTGTGVGQSDALDRTLDTLKSNAIVDAASVAVPAGRIVLVRSSSMHCAIRFDSFRRGHDAKPGTIFNSGDESRFSEADIYEWPRGEGDFYYGKARVKHVKLSELPLVGILKVAAGGGSSIKCTGSRLDWSFPSWMSFIEVGSADRMIEIAPTAWTDLAQIDLANPRLKWFRYEASRERTLIPVAELPGK